jgi:DNA repair photolyase
MQAIYEPKGKAREYCERAANLYRGCGHRCAYCYAPGVLHMKRAEFERAHPRDGIIKALERDAPKHKGREVLLCFTTDPYGPDCGEHDLANRAIVILQKAGCRVNILTKGGNRSTAGVALLRPGLDKYGATLTFASPEKSAQWEPRAAPPAQRIRMLEIAKHLGLETWASIEPVIEPDESLAIMRLASPYVDTFKIGRWNHDHRANAIDWPQFAKRAVDLCELRDVNYMLKQDLAKELRK